MEYLNRSFLVLFLFSLLGWLSLLEQGFAGVFNMPHFVSPGYFAVGFEPELTFTSGANFGMNFKYTHGLSDINNLSAIVGSAGGRGWRAGGSLTFDLFPDVASQPGIGIGLQGLFLDIPNGTAFQATGIPYIHKAIFPKTKGEGTEVEPFLAVPIGLTLSDGRYQTTSTLAIGALFTHSEHFKSIAEFGVGLGNSNTYLAGGITYYQ